MTTIDTPCIGICSSVYGDAVCRGCKRAAIEVIAWNSYTIAEKQDVYRRLQSQIQTVLLRYVNIIDETILQEQICKLNIRLHCAANSIDQAFHLLRLGANKIKDLNRYGLQIKPEFIHLSLSQLFNQIDEEIYALACEA